VTRNDTRELDGASRSLVSRIEDAMNNRVRPATPTMSTYVRSGGGQQQGRKPVHPKNSIQDRQAKELERETQKALQAAKEMAKRRMGLETARAAYPLRGSGRRTSRSSTSMY